MFKKLAKKFMLIVRQKTMDNYIINCEGCSHKDTEFVFFAPKVYKDLTKINASKAVKGDERNRNVFGTRKPCTPRGRKNG